MWWPFTLTQPGLQLTKVTALYTDSTRTPTHKRYSPLHWLNQDSNSQKLQPFTLTQPRLQLTKVTALYTDSAGTLTHSSCFHWITSTASWLLSYSPFDGTHTHMHACMHACTHMHTETKVPKTWPDDVLFTWVPAQVEEEWLSGMIHLVMGRDSLYLLPWAKVHPLTHIGTHAHTYTHTHTHAQT